MSTLLLAEDDATSRKIYRSLLESEGFEVVDVGDGEAALEVLKNRQVDLLVTDVMMPGMSGIDLLVRARELKPELRAIVITGSHTAEVALGALRNRACDFLCKPFHLQELSDTVHEVMQRNAETEIEVISDKPDWIELRVPCDLAAVEPIQRFMAQLHDNLPKDTREAISQVFREMLSNAIEHGGKLDRSKKVDVKYIRLKRAIIYSIRDPGEGFNLGDIDHAAVANPEDNPFRHMEVRQEKGLRPGGFGILLASQVIDELIYNERHNELIFVKYIDEENGSMLPVPHD
ncbi:MAG TPA: response regulator [Blastocatellia bacterium]|nr:response regulator [Blastocatellia bacterium]